MNKNLNLGVIGIDHGHIFDMLDEMLKEGCTCDYFWTEGSPLTLDEFNKKYPNIQSAINLKYTKSTISKIKKIKWSTYDYDRNKEPKKIKIKGSTIAWGITNAIKNSKKTPDVIFHKGDFGKEPMIILFGESPEIVIKKIQKLFKER